MKIPWAWVKLAAAESCGVRLAANILLLLAVLDARADDGRVVGVVLDPSGATIWNAILDLKRDANTDVVSGRTDQKGAFLLPHVRPGSYELVVQADGFLQAVVRGVVVSDGKETRVPSMTLALLPQPSIQLGPSPPLDFQVGSVKLVKIWTTSRGLPLIPFAVFASAWKEQGISLKTGDRINFQVIDKASGVIRRMYEKYGSLVKVDSEVEDSTTRAITFRVIELCSCP